MRNFELNVFTVFGLFSGSLRTSIEIDGFLAGAAVSSVFGFFGILPSFSSVDEPPMTLFNVSLSLSACDTDSTVFERDDEEEDDDLEEEEDLCELLRSLSFSRSRSLSLLLEEEELLPLELRFEEEDEDEEDL